MGKLAGLAISVGLLVAMGVGCPSKDSKGTGDPAYVGVGQVGLIEIGGKGEVRKIVEDTSSFYGLAGAADGTIYATTNDNFHIWKAGKLQTVKLDGRTGTISRLAVASDGSVLGSVYGGVVRWRGGGPWREVDSDVMGKEAKRIRALVARPGMVWVFTESRAFRLADGTDELVEETPEGEEEFSFGYATTWGAQGVIVHGGGAYLRHNGRDWKQLERKLDYGLNTPMQLAEGPDAHLFVKAPGGTFRDYVVEGDKLVETEKRGKGSGIEFMSNVLEVDEAGRVWMGDTKGMHIVDGARHLALAGERFALLRGNIVAVHVVKGGPTLTVE